jgi:hypothetical protein
MDAQLTREEDVQSTREESPLLKGEDGGHRREDFRRSQHIESVSSFLSLLTRSAHELTRSAREHAHELTRSARERALFYEGVGPAAFQVRDAVMGYEAENPAEGAYDPYVNHSSEFLFRNAVSVICHRLCSYRPLIQIFQGTCWFLALLTFIEPPPWCQSGGVTDENNGRVHDCQALLSARGAPADNSTDTHVEYYPNSQSLLVTKSESHRIEALCMALICSYLILRVGRDGMSLSRYLRQGPSRWNRVVQLLSLFLLTVGLATGHTMHHAYVRLALVMTLNNFGTQREIRALIGMIPDVSQILVLLALLILFYAWFGTVMFLGTEEGNLHFPSLVEGMVSLTS